MTTLSNFLYSSKLFPAAAYSNFLIYLGMLSGGRLFVGPRTLGLSLPTLCDHDCIFCIAREEHRLLKEKTRKTLTLEDIKRLIDDAIKNKILKIVIGSCGEPFLYEHIKEVISYINEKGFGKIKICITTNGTNIEKVGIDFLRQNKVDLWTSLHAGDFNTWAKIANLKLEVAKSKFESLKQSLKELSQYRSSATTLHTVINNLNYKRLDNILDFALEVNVKKMNFGFLRNYPEFQIKKEEEPELIHHLLQLKPKLISNGIKSNIDSFIKFTASTHQTEGVQHRSAFYKKNRCFIGWLYSMIEEDGSVLPCCSCNNRKLGNIMETSYSEILKTKFPTFLKECFNIKKNNGKVPDCDCENCAHISLNAKANQLFLF